MNKILIFENPEEFLECINQLQTEYNKAVENQTNTGAGNYE